MRKWIELLVRDFLHFVVHEKRWWIMTLILIISVLVGVVLVNQQRGVRPLIYTLF